MNKQPCRDGEYQFYGSDFVEAGIDKTIPIPASWLSHDNHRIANNHDLLNTRIAIIGESLGDDEEVKKRPFTGTAGATLRLAMKKVGFDVIINGYSGNQPFFEIPRVYFDSVVKIRPSHNDINNLPVGALDYWQDILIKQFTSDTLRPNIIIAVGALPLQTLCGKQYDKISKWRGSILPTWFAGWNEQPIKVIPILTPSYIHRVWEERYLLWNDLERALEQSEYPEIRRPKYNFLINPTINEIEDYADHVKSVEQTYSKDIKGLTNCIIRKKGQSYGYAIPDTIYEGNSYVPSISYDFETRPPFLRSIGFALNETDAICIPFTTATLGDYYKDSNIERRVWKAVAKIFDSALPKIGQNCLTYDLFYAYWYGFRVRNNWLDTMLMSKCLQPELKADLGLLTSLYTSQQYYKDEGKEISPTKEDQDRFWTYNCLDVVTPHVISQKLLDQINKRNLWNVYLDRYLKLYVCCAGLSLKGMRWNQEFHAQAEPFYNWLNNGLQSHLNTLAGKELNIRSTPQMRNFLYHDCNFVTQVTGYGNNQKVAAGAPAIINLRGLYPKKDEVLSTILALSKVKTRISGTINATYDYDGNTRCSYRTAETGRLTSSKCALNTGRNHQNFERSGGALGGVGPLANMRNYIIVEKPKEQIFIEGDLRQAEAYAVAYLANEQEMIEEFRSGVDVHTRFAARIFSIALKKTIKEEDVTKLQRMLGKTVRHGTNYGLGARRLSENIRTATLGDVKVTVMECQKLLDAAHKSAPGIKSRFHHYVEQELNKHMQLRTPAPFNRVRQFWGRRGTKEVHREGYATIPQSTVVDVTNTGLMRLCKQGWDCRLQAHDAVISQVNKEDAVEYILAAREAMKVVLNFSSISEYAAKDDLLIPTDFAYGTTLGEKIELPKDVSEEELRDIFNELRL